MQSKMKMTDLAATLRSELCQRHHDYWWRLRTERDGVPHRRDVDPGEIKEALPNVILHDLGTPGMSMLRLVGTAVAERFGLDPTGRNYLDFVSEERRASALNELLKTATHPCGMWVLIEARYHSGRRVLAETLGYPLIGTQEQPMMMFVDQAVERLDHDLDQRSKPLARFEVRERRYIDIGYGVPAVSA